ncbi:MAG: hypothetical protein IT196_24920 [Acidimicrobiales bacterium]|nr:hypothetical protein [Acidimicrobiales bacterium]
MNDDFEARLRSDLAGAVDGYTPPSTLRDRVNERRSVQQRRAYAGAAAVTVLAGASVVWAATEVQSRSRPIDVLSASQHCAQSSPLITPQDPVSSGGEFDGREWRADFETTRFGPKIGVFVDGVYIGGMADSGASDGRPLAAFNLDSLPGVVVATAWMPTSVAAIQLHMPSGGTQLMCPAALAPDHKAHWFGDALGTAPQSAAFFNQDGAVITTYEFTVLADITEFTPQTAPGTGSTGGYTIDIPFE